MFNEAVSTVDLCRINLFIKLILCRVEKWLGWGQIFRNVWGSNLPQNLTTIQKRFEIIKITQLCAQYMLC
jgi:hypothetical protein